MQRNLAFFFAGALVVAVLNLFGCSDPVSSAAAPTITQPAAVPSTTSAPVPSPVAAPPVVVTSVTVPAPAKPAASHAKAHKPKPVDAAAERAAYAKAFANAALANKLLGETRYKVAGYSGSLTRAT